MLLITFLIIIPNVTPGITNIIGSQTGPNKTPNNAKFDEKIKPTVTKNAVSAYGRKEIWSLPPPASLTASHIEKKYKQG